MKKLIVSLLLLSVAFSAFSIPAKKGKFTYRQPDGSVLVLERHGDEFMHWTTNEAGDIVEQGKDGFYRKAVSPRRSPSLRERPAFAKWSSYETAPSTNFGERSILCLLVEFTDSLFILDDPKAKFSAMLNEEGYSFLGATGSVRDYYIENSHGLFKPSFDVFGPVRLSGPSADYGTSSKQGALALREACTLLDDEIDFSKYDSDGDGKVDMILFYYAGHNEAEGGGEESIWPHQGTASGQFDGVSLGRYFCTSELCGDKGAEMCGIGTTCHEFAHSLGLPDFYDTDYEDNGGKNICIEEYMLMDFGGYLNNGRTPPYLSSIERNMLGWMPNMPFMDTQGPYTLNPVQENDGLQHGSGVEGEYFVYEYRNGERWDSYLPATGLLVYHIDKSSRIVAEDKTAAYLWDETNKFNVYYGHPCCYLVHSSGSSRVFPGIDNVTSFSPEDWDGNNTGHILKDISPTPSALSFTMEKVASDRALWGLVTDTKGRPIEGACVRLSKTVQPIQTVHPAPGKELLSTDFATWTGEDGRYLLEVPDEWPEDCILYASAEGYSTQGILLSLHAPHKLDFPLCVIGEPDYSSFYLYDTSKSGYRFRFNNITSAAVGIGITPEMADSFGYSGAILESVTIKTCIENGEYDRIYVVVYSGKQLLLAKDITDSYTSYQDIHVDVSEAAIPMPVSETLYVGYAITGYVEGSYPFYISGFYDENNGGAFRSRFNIEEPANWIEFNNNGRYFYPFVSVKVAIPHPPVLSDMGVSWMEVPDDQKLTAGMSFLPTLHTQSGKPVNSVSWQYDGEPVPGVPVTLFSGSHSLMAEVLYYDGTTEKVWFDFDVE